MYRIEMLPSYIWCALCTTNDGLFFGRHQLGETAPCAAFLYMVRVSFIFFFFDVGFEVFRVLECGFYMS